MTESTLNLEQHGKYWQRCRKSLLPTQYTSTDSNRMTLGFFILSSHDLLSIPIPADERIEIRNWILHCQHPSGGFCASPNHKYPDSYYVNGEHMDPANLPATFFAILSLGFVGDLEGVKRKECLRWLKSLQREDGSFGELITQAGEIEGGRDMRLSYVAAAVRWILRGDGEGEEEDIDVEALVDFLRAGQTYDGGISESSEHEAHAGYTYCAIAALSFLGRLPNSSSSSYASVKHDNRPGLTSVSDTTRWLVSRQMSYQEEDESDDEAEEGKDEAPAPSEPPTESEDFVGFNGRCNKMVDTCYAFWVGASLDMLGHDILQLINAPSVRRFLYEQTQHRIGGFGKYPGNPPDIYHSYLGLAALATMKEPGLKPLDSALCVSVEQRENISRLRTAGVVSSGVYWKHGYSFEVREDDPEFESKMASSDEPPKALAGLMDAISQQVVEIKA